MTAGTRLLLCAVATVMLSACAPNVGSVGQEDLRDYATTFIPEDASEVEVVPDLPWVQIDFRVRRVPLELAFSSDSLNRAKVEGWILCEPATSEWFSYYDAEVTPMRYTQQRAYMLFRQNVLILLIGTFYSESESAAKRQTAAAAEKLLQYGTIIARDADEADMLETAKAFRLSCS